jgi:hypothetical protein
MLHLNISLSSRPPAKKATFGVNQTDVLDESYRKAGKMDLTKFAARLDIVASGLLETISPDILDGENFETERVLRAEMYKLNVYGSFLLLLIALT